MKNNIIISKYIPCILNMQTDSKKSILDTDIDIELTNIIDYPKCSFGFHHYVHSLKKDTEILKQFENKKKVYLVTNNFEIEIDNYEKSISKEMHKFLKLNEKTPQIISLDFYKIWEILFMFDLFDNDIPLKTSILNDDGTALQTLLLFRNTYSKNFKNDEYYILKTDKINEKILNYYNKTNNIKNDKINDKIDLIISGINFNYENENIIEQMYYKTLFKNLLETLKNQKKNGSTIIKIFETFTNISIKCTLILSSLYEKIFIIKPLTSRQSTSEKFIICIGFKYTDKDKEYKNAYEKINNININLNKYENMKLCDIFKSYNIENQLKTRFIKLNTIITNNLFKAIGENVNFVNGQNYYGDKYQQYRDEQISANNFWIETFLPEPSVFKETKKKIVENSMIANKINMDDTIKLEKLIE